MKNIAILGLGVSGLSVLRLTLYEGYRVYGIDSREPDLYEFIDNPKFTFVKQDHFQDLKQKNIEGLVVSPGISLASETVRSFRDWGVIIYSEIDWGYQYLKDEEVVAVTGTNGKTTTVKMLDKVMRDMEKDVFVGGNLGYPLCDYALSVLKDKKRCQYLILELSSFQIESSSRIRIQSGAILNFSSNHSERYPSLKDYFLAKWLLLSFLKDEEGVVYIDSSVKKTAVSFGLDLDKTIFISDYTKRPLLIPGDHNQMNAEFAYILAKSMLSETDLKSENDIVKRGLESFQGVEHRIERVNLPNERLLVFNDSKSTNWQATRIAVNAVASLGEDISLIVGGKLRGDDEFGEVLKDILKRVKAVYLIGDSAELIYKQFKGSNKNKLLLCFDLKEAISSFKVQDSQNSARTLLFSPAFPSFDRFKNFEHRGEVFKQLCFDLLT